MGQLVNACQTAEEKLVIWTLLDTGMRVSELAAITHQNIDFQTHRITLYGKGGNSGPRSKRRVLKLTDRLRSILEPYIIANRRMGPSVRTIQRVVRRVAARGQVIRATSPHVLRHTFAVTSIQKGISTRALMGWMGHESLRTTEIYLNLSPEDVIREFEEKVL